MLDYLEEEEGSSGQADAVPPLPEPMQAPVRQVLHSGNASLYSGHCLDDKTRLMAIIALLLAVLACACWHGPSADC